MCDMHSGVIAIWGEVSQPPAKPSVVGANAARIGTDAISVSQGLHKVVDHAFRHTKY